jgi:hypothetical protein
VQERVYAGCHETRLLGDFTVERINDGLTIVDATSQQAGQMPRVVFLGSTPDMPIRAAEDHADFTDSTITGNPCDNGIVDGGCQLMNELVHV